MTKEDHQNEVEQARSLLESVVLLETAAASREKLAEEIIDSLSNDGMSSSELAERLNVSQESVETVLKRSKPKAPAERLGIPDHAFESLDPIRRDD